jgi:predicted TIM-barrel fold metal-dependent hydrolase
MPVNGLRQAIAIAPFLRAGTSEAVWRDAHLHIGHDDPDGMTATLEEILEGLDAAGHAGGLVYPMHEPGGYPAANDMIAAKVAASGGRLEWLCRVDPKVPGAVAEAERCLDGGASGIKLHPRSDAFGLPHPVVDELAALAASRRAPVLFHAGRGIPNLGLATADLARRFPAARFILAHAGISDLGLLGPVAAELPNLLFDTSWWNVADMLALVTSIPPGQILYASDMPYGTGLFAAFLLSRSMREAGFGPGACEAVAGTQLERVLAGEPLEDLGPAVGMGGLSARDPALERVTTHTSAVLQLAYAGGEPAEAVALARLGCQHAGDTPHAELLDVADRLLVLATEHRAAADGDPFALLPCLLAAHALCGTPGAGVPDVLP